MSSSFFVGTIFLCSTAFGKDVVTVPKTLDRTVDTVMVEGKFLGECVGKPISSLRVYAYNNGEFKPIRFQIDEMTEDGDWILPEGWCSGCRIVSHCCDQDGRYTLGMGR